MSRETREARLLRQRSQHYRNLHLARRRERYRFDPAYRELCKQRSRAHYARIRKAAE